MRRLLLLFCLPFLLSAATVPSQPQGRFLKTSIKLGEPVAFALVYKHAPEAEVVFPDSSYRFLPFELIRKESFPTRTANNISTDSAIYHLRTFDLEKVQELNLPVFLLQQKDTIPVFGEPAAIDLEEMVESVPEPPVFKEILSLQPVPERFNYPYWLAGFALLIIFLTVIWFSFRQRFLTRFRLYKLAKSHTAFISRYNTYIDRFHRSASLHDMEKAITIWKNHLTYLEEKPINSFTTKEIVTYYEHDEDVTTALKLFDRAIYGNIVSDKISDTLTAFYLLHHFADRRYEFVKENTRNAAIAR
ncbi:MAG TPA: hypothetical protein VK927_10810 [Adhaeribacter sp.]|nr:hypothetical protein [Adhaeribacter sp.]